MKTGRVIIEKLIPNTAEIQGVFHIDFDHSRFGPYTHIFDRKRLYFHEDISERGSYFSPFRTLDFKNTEFFIERNDIVIAAGERGSFSGIAKVFMEIVNLRTQKKYRFYPDEVSLIYNSKENIIIYYRKGKTQKKLTLDIKNLKKVREVSEYVSAFFKLLYNHPQKDYRRLIYIANSTSHQAGYFKEEILANEKVITKDIEWLDMAYTKEPDGVCGEPGSFDRENFRLRTIKYQQIDVWEASLTGKLR